MILGYDNLLKRASLTVNNVDPNYPLENICDKWKRKVYQTEQGIGGVIITADFDTDKVVQSFFALNTNAYYKEVRLYDAGGGLVTIWIMNGLAYHGESVVCRRAEIELYAPTTLYAGGVFLGDSLYFAKTADQDLPMVSTDAPTFSSDSQVSGRHGSVTRGGTITIPLLTAEERQALERAFIHCGLVTPFYLDLWHESHDAFLPLYGVFASQLSVQHEEAGDTVSFDFKEVN